MKLFGVGLLGLLNSPLCVTSCPACDGPADGSLNIAEDLEAQRKEILKENLQKLKEKQEELKPDPVEEKEPNIAELKARASQGCPHAKAQLQEIENEHLKSVHKKELNRMADKGAKHAFEHLSHLNEKDRMKVIAAQASQGCPVAKAELTRIADEKKAKEAAKAAVQKMSSKELKEKAAEGCPYAKKRLLGNNSSQKRSNFNLF